MPAGLRSVLVVVVVAALVIELIDDAANSIQLRLQVVELVQQIGSRVAVVRLLSLGFTI